jgi:stage II sporulation protein P
MKMSYKCINLKDENKSLISRKINYSKCPIKKNGNMRMFFSIFTLMIIFLIGLILPKSAKAYSDGKYQNYFYVKVINNTLSILKSSNTEELYSSRESDIKFATLSLLGVDILNPISIIVKEVPFLKKNETSTDLNASSADIDNSTNIGENLKTFILNPFKLGEKQVSKTGNSVEASNVVAELYNPALKKTLNNAKPEVLIYHSHTCEAYRASDSDTSNVNSSIDETKNVTSVGDVIEEELEKNYGIAVIHDKTVHDKGDYDNSYKKSGVTLDKYLKEYGDFKLIIDLHRDSVNKSVVTTKLNGKNVAKFMFVVTKKNPRYAKQKKLIDSMIGISNKLYPNLLRSTEIHSYDYGIGFYSQNRSDNAVMFEVGSNNNTIDEAKETGKYLARIIAEQLNGKSE